METTRRLLRTFCDCTFQTDGNNRKVKLKHFETDFTAQCTVEINGNSNISNKCFLKINIFNKCFRP